MVTRAAPSKSRAAMSRMYSRQSWEIGHASTHHGRRHWMHRWASRTASSLEYPWRTSRKSTIRSRTGASGTGTRTGLRRGGVRMTLGGTAESGSLIGPTDKPAEPLNAGV